MPFPAMQLHFPVPYLHFCFLPDFRDAAAVGCDGHSEVRRDLGPDTGESLRKRKPRAKRSTPLLNDRANYPGRSSSPKVFPLRREIG